MIQNGTVVFILLFCVISTLLNAENIKKTHRQIKQEYLYERDVFAHNFAVHKSIDTNQICTK